MDSGMIGKIEKAIRYAQERDRFQFEQFTVQGARGLTMRTLFHTMRAS